MQYIKHKQISDSQILVEFDKGTFNIYGIKENIVRMVYSINRDIESASELIESKECVKIDAVDETEKLCIRTSQLIISIEKTSGDVKWLDRNTGKVLLREKGKELRKAALIKYTTRGEKPKIERVHTVDGERNFVKNLVPIEDGIIYKGKLKFEFKDEESIHGLGQSEEGIYNYRSHVQYLYQHNMRIPIPFMVSSEGYGILFDAACLMTFNDDERGNYIYLDAIPQLDYYFISGDSDTCISGYRTLTGKASMLPKYSFGYVQSKEAYNTQEELIDVASEYRKRGIGLDVIVQDWNTWEDGKWGNKIVDKKRYPNLSKMNEELHGLNVHSMVSVWPNMNSGTENYKEMEENNLLLNDYATYDAFSEEGRKLYWKQMNEELFSGGFDAWWCDSTEPFSGPDWNGEYMREPWERFNLVGEEHKKFLEPTKANLYATMHAKGIYENQRKESDNRVLNLTRSGYTSIQKYGTVLWSGDTFASWDTLKKQITEGINMSISGIPYWTLDVGGFFTVKEKWEHRGCNCNTDSEAKWFWKGDYEDGVDDLGYKELYVRWLWYAIFLPMFRSHGTDTPREIWNFGEPHEMFYDAIESAINLRYKLMPYIYSLAGSVHLEDKTMVRSLMFDFANDENAKNLCNQYMFGESLMVCPVTKPMYYDRNSKELNTEKKWRCYLPTGVKWFDFYTGKEFEGGQYIVADAAINKIPIFVRAGSVIPMEEKLEYANEQVETPINIFIYPGADATFYYYEDDGESYEYENGRYNYIRLSWSDEKNIFKIGSAKYNFSNSLVGRKCCIRLNNKSIEFIYQGKELEICL
ncbi:MAG: TIM-barrel domain-containing protein [Suipraeoptans sp.]